MRVDRKSVDFAWLLNHSQRRIRSGNQQPPVLLVSVGILRMSQSLSALAHLENPNTRRAQRHGVNADINVTVFVLARHSRPYIIFGTDSKC